MIEWLWCASSPSLFVTVISKAMSSSVGVMTATPSSLQTWHIFLYKVPKWLHIALNFFVWFFAPLPGQQWENILIVLCLSGTEVILQLQVTLANVVTATALVYKDNLSKTEQKLFIWTPMLSNGGRYISKELQTDTYVPLRQCFLAGRG